MIFMIYWILGIFVGFLSGLLGVGGGILITPALVFIFHHQGLFPSNATQIAVGSSLAIIAFSALGSLTAHQYRKNIDWRLVVYLLPGLIGGSLVGTYVATIVPSNFLAKFLGVFVLLISFKMQLPQKKLNSIEPEPFLVRIIGCFIGILGGLLGIGGGVLLIPFLEYCRVPIHRAVGTSIASSFFVSLAGTLSLMTIAYFSPVGNTAGYIFWPAVVGIISTSILFAWVGALVATKLDVKTLKRIFAIFLIFVGGDLILSY